MKFRKLVLLIILLIIIVSIIGFYILNNYIISPHTLAPTSATITTLTTVKNESTLKVKKKPFVWAWIYSTASSDVKTILSQYGASVIDIVSPDWYYLTEDMSIGVFTSRGAEDNSFITLARERNISLIPMIVSSNASRVKNLITDSSAIERFAEKMIEIARKYGYSGFNIDFEVSLPDYAREFSEFINILADKLHRENLILSVDIPAKRYEYPSSYLRTYDYQLIGASRADYIIIMAYDYYESPGPKPVAPTWWVEECIKYALNYIPREKLVLGVPNYGKLWSRGGSLIKWLLFQDYISMKNQGINFTIDSSVEELKAEVSQGIAYYIDGELAYYRARLVLSYDLAGVAVWRLDNGDPSTWDYLKKLKIEFQPPPDYPLAKWISAYSGNFAESNRSSIRWIVIHVTESSADSAINWFKNPSARVSAHYIVALNGSIYQMVREKDIAWHAGNKDYNAVSIGIEHEGFVDAKLFTEEQYRASARLVAYLLYKYNIPLYHPADIAPANASEGGGIIGHDQVPDPKNPSLGGGASHHRDPGPNWDWNKYLELVSIYLNALKDRSYEKAFSAVWFGVYSDKWSSDRSVFIKQIDDSLYKLSIAGIKAVFFLAKDPWGYVYYNSSYAPMNPKYSWDVLRDIITIAKKHGVKVYVYLNVLSEGETQPNFYLKEHSNMALYDENNVMLGWVDPYCREYIERVLNIVRELITKYPEIYGVQLDRIRAPQDKVFGVCSAEMFRKIYGKDPREDPYLYKKFLADGITSVVREIATVAKSIRPDIKISAAVFPSSQAVSTVLQDWPRWVNENILDYVVTMTYVSDLDSFKRYIDDQLRAVKDPEKIYIGIGTWRLSEPNLLSQISYVIEQLKLRGFFLFNLDSVIEKNFTETLLSLRITYLI